MVDVFLSLGSNVEREAHIRSGLAQLQERFGRLRVSSIYESAAVGFEGDPFYNLVVGFRSELPVEDIAQQLHELEVRHGKTPESRKFAPRGLDIDLLLYGDQVLQEGRLRLPREDLLRYAFMLEPMAELAPGLKHPLLGRTYAELWAEYDKRGVSQRRIPWPWPDWPAAQAGCAEAGHDTVSGA